MSSARLDADLDLLDAAALRELVVALRAKNSALEARAAERCVENTELETTSQSSRSVGVVKAPRRVTLTEDNDARALPLELLIMIADYFEPGSRSLLNLARSCHDLYMLLIARLYKSFSARCLYRDIGVASRKKKQRPQVPHGLDVIERLDVMSGFKDEMAEWIDLVHNARGSLVELACDSNILTSLSYIQLPKLRKLTVDLTELPAYIVSKWQCAPNLETLKLLGPPDVKVMNMLGSGLPTTARIDIEIVEYENWEPEQMSEAFVSKIRSWVYFDIPMVAKLIATFPMFSPSQILRSSELQEVADADMSVEYWKLITGLRNLEHLELDRLTSTLILSMRETIQKLSVLSFELSLQTDADLTSLGAWIASTLPRTRLSLFHHWIEPEEMSRSRYKTYLRELALWETVPGFECEVSSVNLTEQWEAYWDDEE